MNSNFSIKKGADIELEIDDLAFKGLGIAHINNQIVFVKNAIPGQRVLCRITKKRSSYLEARKLNIINQTKYYIKPICDHFNDCGGCTFQDLNYSKQLYYKQIQIKDIFSHIGGFSDINIKPIIKCDNIFEYRNKMEFSFSNRRWILDNNDTNKNKDFALGLHVPGRYDKILNIDHCHLQAFECNKILSIVKDYSIKHKLLPYDVKTHQGFLRHLVIRKSINNNQIMVNFVTSIENANIIMPIVEMIKKELSNVTSIVNNINTKKADIAFGEWEVLLDGENHIIEKLDKFEFEISANSFFQTNTIQAEILYTIIKEECQLNGKEIVYDLYCGVGSISIFIANDSKEVYGIELIEPAIINAKKNAKRNNINNVHFYCGDLINILKDQDALKIPKPNIIIIDPPRSGMHKNTIKDILKLSPDRIIYCSCNPSTQARDLNLICKGGYSLHKLRPIDMFPHTPHIECVATLIKANV